MAVRAIPLTQDEAERLCRALANISPFDGQALPPWHEYAHVVDGHGTSEHARLAETRSEDRMGWHVRVSLRGIPICCCVTEAELAPFIAEPFARRHERLPEPPLRIKD